MKYERFTKRIGDFVTNHCKPSCPYYNVCEDDDCHCDKAALEILAELEDKIEQGTLIEVKYPLYSDVYIIDYVDENGYSIDGATPTVRKCYVSFITQSLRDSFLYRVQPYDLPKAVEEGTITHIERWEIYSFLEKELFLTREEAEKRMLELQGDK